jgi:hypothetical protein
MKYTTEKLHRILNKEIVKTRKELDYFTKSDYVFKKSSELKINILNSLTDSWKDLSDDILSNNAYVDFRVEHYLNQLLKTIINFKSWELSQHIMNYVNNAIEDKTNKEIYKLLKEDYFLSL